MGPIAWKGTIYRLIGHKIIKIKFVTLICCEIIKKTGILPLQVHHK